MKTGDTIDIVIKFPGGVEVDGIAMVSWTQGENGEYGCTVHVPNCYVHFDGEGKHVAELPDLPHGVGHGMIGPNLLTVKEPLPPRKEKKNAELV